MRRRPRSLFRARRRGDTLHIGPHFVGAPPNYEAKVEVLVKTAKLTPGKVTQGFIYHDDDCAAMDGGPCDCDPDVKLGPEL